MRATTLLCILFAGFIETSAMYEPNVNLTSIEWREKAKDELSTIIKIEEDFPGFFAQRIVNSLKKYGGVYSAYFGIQASSNTRGMDGIYQRSLTLDSKDINQLYERENWELKAKLPTLKQEKQFKAKNLENINTDSQSNLTSDLNKNLYVNVDDTNKHFDMNRSIYEALRETYKNRKVKESPVKAFNLHDFTDRGFSVIENKANPHLLEQIIVSNFNGIIQHENALIKDEFTYEIFNWCAKIFDIIASLDIKNEITDKQSLYDNQRLYDTFCCLYETYHHLIFMLLTYQHDKGKQLYSYEYYKKSMQIIDQARLPNTIQGMIQEHIVTKSGMDAVVKALIAVQSLDTNGITSPKIIPICDRKETEGVEEIYFEIEQKIVKRFSKKLPIPTYLSGISCARYVPNNDYNTNIIIENATKAGNQALILDTTVQLPDSKNDPVCIILDDERIKEKLDKGELVIFLAKSFQKFATLGTQKMRAGDLTVIGNQDSELVRMVLKTLRSQFDDLFTTKTWGAELQWMTHLLNYNGADELRFLAGCNQAVKEFVKTNYGDTIADSFSMLLVKPKQGYYGIDNYIPTVFPTGMQSFGYAFANQTEYPHPFILRFNLGLEPMPLLEQLSNSYNKNKDEGIWKKNENILFKDQNYIVDLKNAVDKFQNFLSQEKQYKDLKKDDLASICADAQKLVLKKIVKSLDEDKLIFWDFWSLQDKFKVSSEEITEYVNNLCKELKDTNITINSDDIYHFKIALKQKQKEYDLYTDINYFIMQCKIDKLEKLLNKEPSIKQYLIGIENFNELPNEQKKELKNKIQTKIDESKNDEEIIDNIIEFLKNPENIKAKKLFSEIEKNPNNFFYSPKSFTLIQCKGTNLPKFIKTYIKDRINSYQNVLDKLVSYTQKNGFKDWKEKGKQEKLNEDELFFKNSLAEIGSKLEKLIQYANSQLS